MVNEKYSEVGAKDVITEQIISCAYKVHRELGPGFNEKIYHNALKLALTETGLDYETEKEFKVIYQKKKVGLLRIDLIVRNRVIVEVKAVTGSMPLIFEAQLLSYLKVACCRVGLLINFGGKSCYIRRLML